VEYLKNNNIYNFTYPEGAASSIAKMVKFKDLTNKQNEAILKIKVNEKNVVH